MTAVECAFDKTAPDSRRRFRRRKNARIRPTKLAAFCNPAFYRHVARAKESMGRAEAERRGDGKRDDDSGMFRAEFEMPTAVSTRVNPLAWAGPTSVSPTLIRDDVAGAKKHGVTEARRMPSSWVRPALR